MVKILLTALVCGSFSVAYTSAQEVFNADQKARPKYPKAIVASEQSKTAVSTPVAPELSKAHPAVALHKSDVAPTKKVTATAINPATAKVTKATPTVMPGQRAPAATPSPIVKPEPPLVAKAQVPSKEMSHHTAQSTTNPKVPLAAVPPPGKATQVSPKVAKAATIELHTQSGAVAPNKVAAKATAPVAAHSIATAAAPTDFHTKTVADASVKAAKIEAKPAAPTKPSVAPSIAAVTKSAVKESKTNGKPANPTTVVVAVHHPEPAPPGEGPKHDIVVSAKKQPAAVTQTKTSAKLAAVAKVPTPAEETEEDASSSTSRPAAKQAPATVASVAVKKPTGPAKLAVDAHAISAVPASLQTRKESLPTVTRVSLAQSAASEQGMIPSPAEGHFQTAFTKLADGFDFPVGRPDAQGYYRARGFRAHGHLGEDWDGVGGGDTDLGDPIYCIADGLVVFARDCHMGWGNVVIVRHSYREGGAVRTVDSLYGHLNSILVRKGQAVARGQKIATMGTAHGLYDAHLHLEIRKNIEIGMSRAAFAQDFSNYYDPSQFIQAHRHLQSGGGNYRVALNTFTRDSRIRWDRVRNYSHPHTGGGSSESAAALKRALAAKNQ